MDRCVRDPTGTSPVTTSTRTYTTLRDSIDIHVDAIARYLYHIQPDGTAMRYGVAIGRSGLY